MEDVIARRQILLLAAAGPLSLAAETGAKTSVRGAFTPATDNSPATIKDGPRTVRLAGDEPTTKILHDGRLRGFELEAKGHFTGADAFLIDKIENRSMLAYKAGKAYRVTYYCDICSIRTYSPGPCMCCQQETRLDLIDPATPDQ